MSHDHDQKLTFQKLSLAIQELLEQPRFVHADSEKLKDLFFEHLSAVFQISFDLQIPVSDIKQFFSGVEKLNDIENDALFLATVLENTKTYTLLNYFCYEFIRAYVDVTKDEYRESVDKVLVDHEITEQDVQSVIEHYKMFSQPSTHATYLH